MKLLVTGGGTGGHVYPALAIAGLLKQRDPASEVLYVGTSTGLESRVVPGEGYPFREIVAVKWPRKLGPGTLPALGAIIRGYRQGVEIIREFKPQAVFATGGYVSVPLSLAAVRTGVPVFLHEQNAVPGLANRLLSRWAKAVFTTFPVPDGVFPKAARLMHTGLPVRREVLETSRQEGLHFFGLDDHRPVLLVTGGSRGAHAINQVMLQVYRMAARGETDWPELQVIHLTGKEEYQDFLQQMTGLGISEENFGKIVIVPYLEEMHYALAAADLMIGRAGAATLAEVTVKGIPAILIPYPFATGDHQYHNARLLAEQGAAVLIKEQELSATLIAQKIEKILTDNELRLRMGSRMKEQGRPEAGRQILREIIQGIGKKRK